MKFCSHLEVLPCGGKGAGRYPLKNVNTRLLVQRFLRSAKPRQVQEFTGKPGRRRGVPSASCETASQAGCCGKCCPGDGGRKPTPAGPPALLLLGGDSTGPGSRDLVSDMGTCARGPPRCRKHPPLVGREMGQEACSSEMGPGRERFFFLWAKRLFVAK